MARSKKPVIDEEPTPALPDGFIEITHPDLGSVAQIPEHQLLHYQRRGWDTADAVPAKDTDESKDSDQEETQ